MTDTEIINALVCSEGSPEEVSAWERLRARFEELGAQEMDHALSLKIITEGSGREARAVAQERERIAQVLLKAMHDGGLNGFNLADLRELLAPEA